MAKKNRRIDILAGNLAVPKLLLKIAALIVCASILPGCGGGEDFEDLADTGRIDSSDHEPPGRGPEWLMAPAEEMVSSAG